jgi:hypothetical protein
MTVRNENLIVYIPELYQAQTSVLPQIKGTEAAIASNFEGGITIFNETTTHGMLLNLAVSGVIQWIWGKFVDMSFLTILSLVSITVPGIAKII